MQRRWHGQWNMSEAWLSLVENYICTINFYTILQNIKLNVLTRLFTVKLILHYCIHIYLYTELSYSPLFHSWFHLNVTCHYQHTFDFRPSISKCPCRQRSFISPDLTSEMITKTLITPWHGMKVSGNRQTFRNFHNIFFKMAITQEEGANLSPRR